jgi:hypothetical protein
MEYTASQKPSSNTRFFDYSVMKLCSFQIKRRSPITGITAKTFYRHEYHSKTSTNSAKASNIAQIEYVNSPYAERFLSAPNSLPEVKGATWQF